MCDKELKQLIEQMESHLECWKQFNQFINLARTRKFAVDDDHNFLEVKSVLVQELEMITSTIETTSPSKEEIHSLITNAPSLRYLGEMNEGALRNLESQWHQIYIGWHSILGQLKVKQRAVKAKSKFESFFGKAAK